MALIICPTDCNGSRLHLFVVILVQIASSRCYDLCSFIRHVYQMYAWHGIHYYTQLMHGSVRLGLTFSNNSRRSNICQAYKTCSFIKYKSKNVKCARVYKQCQERCLNCLMSVNNYKVWKIYHDRHVFCFYFWQSRCKLFFKASILASLDLLGNMHINLTLLVLACNYCNSPLASLASASCRKKERQYNKKKS